MCLTVILFQWWIANCSQGMLILAKSICQLAWLFWLLQLPLLAKMTKASLHYISEHQHNNVYMQSACYYVNMLYSAKVLCAKIQNATGAISNKSVVTCYSSCLEQRALWHHSLTWDELKYSLRPLLLRTLYMLHNS